MPPKKYKLRIGSRAQVMHGTAKMTGGGLKKKDLKYNKHGKIVSKKVSSMARKEKRLQKAGYMTQKGQFGTIRNMEGGGMFYFIIFTSTYDYEREGILTKNTYKDFATTGNTVISNPFEIYNYNISWGTTKHNQRENRKNAIIEKLKNYGRFNIKINDELIPFMMGDNKLEDLGNRLYKFCTHKDRPLTVYKRGPNYGESPHYVYLRLGDFTKIPEYEYNKLDINNEGTMENTSNKSLNNMNVTSPHTLESYYSGDRKKKNESLQSKWVEVKGKGIGHVINVIKGIGQKTRYKIIFNNGQNKELRLSRRPEPPGSNSITNEKDRYYFRLLTKDESEIEELILLVKTRLFDVSQFTYGYFPVEEYNTGEMFRLNRTLMKETFDLDTWKINYKQIMEEKEDFTWIDRKFYSFRVFNDVYDKLFNSDVNIPHYITERLNIIYNINNKFIGKTKNKNLKNVISKKNIIECVYFRISSGRSNYITFKSLYVPIGLNVFFQKYITKCFSDINALNSLNWKQNFLNINRTRLIDPFIPNINTKKEIKLEYDIEIGGAMVLKCVFNGSSEYVTVANELVTSMNGQFYFYKKPDSNEYIYYYILKILSYFCYKFHLIISYKIGWEELLNDTKNITENENNEQEKKKYKTKHEQLSALNELLQTIPDNLL